MTHHRLVHGIVLGVMMALPPVPVQARCVPLGVTREVSRARYVVEAVLEERSEDVATFRVTASWVGEPPSQLAVHLRPRTGLPPGSVGDTYLLLLQGETDELRYDRCGSSRRLSSSSAAIGALRALGLTRAAR